MATDVELWRAAAQSRELVAGVAVAYDPDSSVIQNLRSYADQVDVLYVIDNSEPADPAFSDEVRSIPRAEYESAGGNIGVAAALNLGASKALAAGYSMLLTMDQDTRIPQDLVRRLAESRLSYLGGPVGLCAPAYLDPLIAGSTSRRDGGFPRGVRPMLTVITSGSLVSLSAYEEVGPFRDDLFIDQVDNEFCLRLHRMGYQILMAGDIVLHHTVGSLTIHKVLGAEVYTSNHTPIRKYYIVRNRLSVGREYRSDFPQFYRFERGQIVLEAVKIILLESRKLQKLRMMTQGYIDYRVGRLGPYR